MLRRVLKRANLMSFIFQGYDLDQLNETSQDKWFHHCWSERHCLHHLFTVKSRQHGAMHLRQHGHDFVLRNIKYDFNKRHFIAPSLFIMSKFYVFVLCVRVCIVWTVFYWWCCAPSFLCKRVHLSCVFYNKLTYLPTTFLRPNVCEKLISFCQVLTKMHTKENWFFFFCLVVYIYKLPSVLWCCWLGGRKGIWPVKNWAVGCWIGYLSGVRCWLAYVPADASANHCLLLQ